MSTDLGQCRRRRVPPPDGLAEVNRRTGRVPQQQQRLRLIANFQHTQLKGVADEDLSANKLQLAVQAQFF